MNLKDKFNKEIAGKLKEKFGYKNNFQVPRLNKVVINVGFGRNLKDNSFIESVTKTLTKISGQKPILTKAKKSISAFKIREGMVIGAAVTLRGDRMYDFMDKLINVTFPRVRDFRGIKKDCLDRNGNLTVGFKENIAFPEIKMEEVENIHGMEVCVATSAKSKEEGYELFKLLGFPFKED
jgi:large subunit ribosomal protein L5